MHIVRFLCPVICNRLNVEHNIHHNIEVLYLCLCFQHTVLQFLM